MNTDNTSATQPPMSKAERRDLIKQRFEALEAKENAKAVKFVPAEIIETVQELDGFREHVRDRHSDSEFLTSDEQ